MMYYISSYGTHNIRSIKEARLYNKAYTASADKEDDKRPLGTDIIKEYRLAGGRVFSENLPEEKNKTRTQKNFLIYFPNTDIISLEHYTKEHIWQEVV
jgi:hypothetical protein